MNVMFISEIVTLENMATAKTSDFWLTERITIDAAAVTAGTPQVATIDLGAYVDVGDQQAISISEADFIFQGVGAAGEPGLLRDVISGDSEFSIQVSDLNPGGILVYADENSLVGSGEMFWDSSSGPNIGADLYPDNFGKTAGRIIVNDQLYCVLDASGSVGAGEAVSCVVRLKCRIVKLSTRDWMAIAIQSTANDT